MKKIKVTDIETGKESVYDYSRDNWRKHPACMLGGRVIMWATHAREGVVTITSGRKWEILN